jgi:hypothetical protein
MDRSLAQWVEAAAEGADAVRYLACGPTDTLTGHAISVDGGASPW